MFAAILAPVLLVPLTGMQLVAELTRPYRYSEQAVNAREKIAQIDACMNGKLLVSARRFQKYYVEYGQKWQWLAYTVKNRKKAHGDLSGELYVPYLKDLVIEAQSEPVEKIHNSRLGRLFDYYVQDDGDWYVQEEKHAMQKFREFVNLQDLDGNNSKAAQKIKANRQAFLNAILASGNNKQTVQIVNGKRKVDNPIGDRSDICAIARAGQRSLRLENPVMRRLSKLAEIAKK
ncbi:MAG TPA: hypothetical protein VGT41_06520 [Candidatus Babeliales bacterium]|nr:hypothetical protein [Candidatus Babeliales bacterium]